MVNEFFEVQKEAIVWVFCWRYADKDSVLSRVPKDMAYFIAKTILQRQTEVLQSSTLLQIP
jgi:hypothetical protein